MKKLFYADKVVKAMVVDVPNTGYFYAQNGDPGLILCGREEAGWLSVNSGGQIIHRPYSQMIPLMWPKSGDKIILNRESTDPKQRGFVRTYAWATDEEWEKVSWAANANDRYQVVAVRHRTNGTLNDRQPELELASGTLKEIVRSYPRQSPNDTLASGYTTRLGKVELSYDVEWRKHVGDSLAKCDWDPRPK